MNPGSHASSTSNLVSPPTMKEAFDELELKFLYSLPQEELQAPDRLFNELEQAFWYYEDHLADRFRHL